MKKSDRELGMDREINRRDFLNGASIAIAGAVLAPGASGASTAWMIPSTPPIDEPVPTGGTGHYLYVATPGIRDHLGDGGNGLMVFDIDNNHKFV